MNPTLTVFTPTFNRAYCLNKCYESLVRQTSQDFLWLIIDDGSTDNTRLLVEEWIREDKIKISYYYQDNQGMHGAHNTAYEKIETELNVCIDSDDFMSDDAVEKIVSFWTKHGSDLLAGIVALDATPTGEIIGTTLPTSLTAATLTELYGKYKIKGDKKLVYRTKLMKETPPYPLFVGEKYCPLSYKYILIDQKCPLLIMNEIVCYVDYQTDGSSMNMIHQYKKNPRGFSFFRKVAMKYAPTYKERVRETIHYISSNLLIRNFHYIAESPCKFTTFLFSPAGWLLYLYIINTERNTIGNVRKNT
ncbi:glycosyltransferase family 2 protein [Alkalihalobacterium bogoriense]|uniref:glycosyltransferase family 2 protein n=1 Tax=Alkalihalobacterium bogoriense TaxID=246272 RepID=UPI00047B1D76|nr:glycosyltransferase family A protein [Alkalihalobacterium bogoriense]